jgi:Fe-S cluster assembly iron-binding protein IscA
LSADQIRESDLVQEVDELMFVISPETYQLLGEVTISYRDEPGRKGFVITSIKPVSEWEGFGVSNIKF